MRRTRQDRQNSGWQQIVRLILLVVLAAVTSIYGRKYMDSNTKYDPVPADVRGAARLIDGDSLYVGRDEVRLKGIDAPEGRQTCTRDGRSWDCGNAARDELSRLIGNDTVVCTAAERDQHGRVLAYCSAGGRDLNAGMVSSGMALAYGGYTRQESEARAKKRGLWAGDFEPPRDWRHERGIGL